MRLQSNRSYNQHISRAAADCAAGRTVCRRNDACRLPRLPAVDNSYQMGRQTFVIAVAFKALSCRNVMSRQMLCAYSFYSGIKGYTGG